MNILSINSSTKQYSLAVLRDENLLGEYVISSGSNHYAGLMQSLDELMNKTDLVINELNGIVITLGPGTFTGIRVGLSLGMGICQALNIPIVGLHTLHALASQLPFVKKNICSIVTSRKNEVFAALFRWDKNGSLSRIKGDICIGIQDIGSLVKDNTIVIGNDFVQHGQILKDMRKRGLSLAPADLWNLRASSAGILGLKKIAAGKTDSLGTISPIYLRDADIRPPRPFNFCIF